MLFAIWLGCGCAALLAALGRGRFPFLAPVAALACAALLSAPAPARAARVDASQDQRATAFAAAVLAAAPRGAIVVTAADRDTFALWYAHYALGERQDLAVVVDSLLDEPWYRANLRAVYPWLRIPENPPSDWALALRAANGAPVCRTSLDGPQSLGCRP